MEILSERFTLFNVHAALLCECCARLECFTRSATHFSCERFASLVGIWLETVALDYQCSVWAIKLIKIENIQPKRAKHLKNTAEFE